MRVLFFEVSNIHGYLNRKIVFDKSITYITGINGTGKTSIVRSILSITQPSLLYLVETEYDYIRVRIEVDNIVHDLVATKTNEKFKFYKITYDKIKAPRVTTKLENLPEPNTEDIFEISILHRESFESITRYKDRLFEYISEQETISVNHPLMQFLRSVPTPMFLGLERRSESEMLDDGRRGNAQIRRSRGMFSGGLYDSLIEAKRLAEEAYVGIATEQRELAINLRKNIILALFRVPTSTTWKWPDEKYISNLRTKVSQLRGALNSIEIEDGMIEKHVMPFFKELELISSKIAKFENPEKAIENDGAKEHFFRWISLIPQEARVDAVFKLVDSYNKNTEELRGTATRYEKLVNSFLVDSGKSIRFTANGILSVELPNKTLHSLTSLSSGESHIVVILTHLFFNRRNNQSNVLIIDEPELSLHIKWQESFVSAVLSASKNLQVILATHSPAIFLDNISQCVDLS